MIEHDSSGSHPPPPHVGRRHRPGRLLGSAVVAAAAFGTLAATPVAADDIGSTADIAVERSEHRVEAMRLNCSARDGDVAAIGCRWSVPDGAAGIRLIRVALGSGMGRVTVYRTDDPTDNTHVDTPVRRGVRYLYAVRAVDSAGRLVGASRPVIAGVPKGDTPAVEVLRLRCEATGTVTARCEWSLPDGPARVVTLWRSVDGAAREQVASFRVPFPTSYGDQVPSSSSRAVYAVIATDGAGEIVARSRADGVAFPDADPAAVDVDPVDTRPVETRPVDTRPVDSRPVDSRPVDSRPVDSRPVDSRPVDTRPVDSRPVDSRPVDSRPVDTRPDVPVHERPDSVSTRDGDRTN